MLSDPLSANPSTLFTLPATPRPLITEIESESVTIDPRQTIATSLASTTSSSEGLSALSAGAATPPASLLPQGAATTKSPTIPSYATAAGRAVPGVRVGAATESTPVADETTMLEEGMSHLVIVDRACSRAERFARGWCSQGAARLTCTRVTLHSIRPSVPDREVCVVGGVGHAAEMETAAKKYNDALLAEKSPKSPVALACANRPMGHPTWLIRPMLARSGEPINPLFHNSWGVRLIQALKDDDIDTGNACLVTRGDGLWVALFNEQGADFEAKAAKLRIQHYNPRAPTAAPRQQRPPQAPRTGVVSMGPIEPLSMSAALGQHIATKILATQPGATTSIEFEKAQLRTHDGSTYFTWRVAGVVVTAKKFTFEHGGANITLMLDPVDLHDANTGLLLQTRVPPVRPPRQDQAAAKPTEAPAPEEQAGGVSRLKRQRPRRSGPGSRGAADQGARSSTEGPRQRLRTSPPDPSAEPRTNAPVAEGPRDTDDDMTLGDRVSAERNLNDGSSEAEAAASAKRLSGRPSRRAAAAALEAIRNGAVRNEPAVSSNDDSDFVMGSSKRSRRKAAAVARNAQMAADARAGRSPGVADGMCAPTAWARALSAATGETVDARAVQFIVTKQAGPMGWQSQHFITAAREYPCLRAVLHRPNMKTQEIGAGPESQRHAGSVAAFYLSAKGDHVYWVKGGRPSDSGCSYVDVQGDLWKGQVCILEGVTARSGRRSSARVTPSDVVMSA